MRADDRAFSSLAAAAGEPVGGFLGGLGPSAGYVLHLLATAGVIVVTLLVAVAYYTLLDRKVLGAMQRRLGPDVVGPYGLLQPLADGLKALAKETIVPTSANTRLFLLAPVLTFATSMAGYAVLPFSEAGALVTLDTGLLYVLTVSTLGVYGVILAGWSSNSKYAFLGALRSSAQMVSYEVSLGFILLSAVVLAQSTHLYALVLHQQGGAAFWHCWFLWPQCLLFLISAVAETNRAPFDLPEAEAELVAGYFLDYSSLAFALFFLGEYASMLMMAAMTTVVFFGGWYAPIPGVLESPVWLGIKVSLLCFVWVWVRATFPRYRFDQLMALGWKSFLPLSVTLFFATVCALQATNAAPAAAWWA